jgi:hypothetical protein
MQAADVLGDPPLFGFLLRFHGGKVTSAGGQPLSIVIERNSGLIVAGSCLQETGKLLAQRGWLQDFPDEPKRATEFRASWLRSEKAFSLRMTRGIESAAAMID